MLSDILGEKIKIKTHLDRHLNIHSAEEKLGIMDLRVELEDKTKCNIEVQLNRHEFENERFLYYLANAYSSQLNRGNNYSELNKTISIIIIDHELSILNGFDELNVSWQMRDSITGKRLLTDKFQIVIIEIPKAKRIYSKNAEDKISQWMMFLDDPNSKEVSNIMNRNKDIQDAANELKDVSGDYEIRRIAELKEKYIRDEKAALAYAINTGIKEGIDKGFKQGIDKGIKQGIEQGIEQGINTVAINMLKMDFKIDQIAKATGLSKEKILELKNAIK